MNYLKYFKALGYIFVPMLVLNLIISIFHYFNLMNGNMIDYIKLFIIAISMIIGGIYIGGKTTKKGWLEGLKIGLIVIFMFFVVGYLAFDKSVGIKSLIYFLILLASSTLGSMIGISKRKQN